MFKFRSTLTSLSTHQKLRFSLFFSPLLSVMLFNFPSSSSQQSTCNMSHLQTAAAGTVISRSEEQTPPEQAKSNATPGVYSSGGSGSASDCLLQS